MYSRVISIFLLTIVLSTLAFGQGNGGSMTGKVIDPSGAVIPGATVKAVQIETGTTILGTTSDTGNYRIQNMPIGPYEVTVERQGFKKFDRKGLDISSSNTITLDIKLEVGATTDTVTVSATSTLLQQDSGQVVRNINPEQIQNLPVMNVATAGLTFIRDPFALTLTQAGTQQAALGAGYLPRVNGLPQNQGQIRVEGEVVNNDTPGLSTRNNVSPDAVQEIAIQTSNYNAEYGSVSGALFNLTLKSGTNQYHGTGYDYGVNEILDASDPSVHTKVKIRRHDYGFNFGGPVKIPKLYNGTNKTFFFFNWEQLRDFQTQPSSNTTVPTDAYRAGDFSYAQTIQGGAASPIQLAAITTGPLSGQRTAHIFRDAFGNQVTPGTIYDPNTLTPFTCTATAVSAGYDCGGLNNTGTLYLPFDQNKIPLTRIDRVAYAMQSKYIPEPVGLNASNGSAVNNYQTPYSTSRVTREPSLKIDQNITSRGRLSFSWNDTHTDSPTQGTYDGLPNSITTVLGSFASAPTYRVNFDYTLKPTMIAHIGLGYQSYTLDGASPNSTFNPLEDIGLAGARVNRNFPAVASTITANPAVGGMNAMGAPSQSITPERFPSTTESLTWIRGNHSFKIGGEIRKNFYVTENFTNTAGSLGFGSVSATSGTAVTWDPAFNVPGVTGTGITVPTATVGNLYASFLLGGVKSFTLATPIEYRLTNFQYGAYLQDTWRIRRNLTLDFGVRWDLGTYKKEDYGRVGELSLTLPNPAADNRPGAYMYEATCGCQFSKNYPYAIGPRVGFAYTLNPRTVIRGGVGISYGSINTGALSASTNNSVSTPTGLTARVRTAIFD